MASDDLKNSILARKGTLMKGLILFHDALSYVVPTGETKSDYEKYLDKRIQFKVNS